MAFKTKHYGWVRDLPDHRDHLYAAPVTRLAALPAKVDLTAQCPPVYDQGSLGSCTANGIAAALQFDRMKQNLQPPFNPSRLFIYYNERVIEHTVDSDSGAMIRDGFKSVAKQGDCPETSWPYDIGQFRSKPPKNCYTEALKYKVVQYSRLVQNLNQMKGCLADGYPIVFGFSVYESFESAEVAQTGIVPMPSPQEQLLGGHCVVAVGYDDAQQRFIVRNSWGESWGKNGYCTMPYAYLTDTDLSSDFWTIRLVAA
ncbi:MULTISPECIES: C1 family peptidase [Caballeronia]|jgi:C1A family cysteine protease|uniref:C1 family peptidase n=1 Tax=Caballeronia jiangsuensis TaxID=1458357 RepID=A0ABW9CHT0_9BURK|nr:MULTISPECIES: C1 family peptidase [Caballeronia]GJH10092.1 C1 family peptidase [Caballeronia novacaledonica]